MPVTLRVPASSQSAATAHAASCADASVPATGSTPTSSSAAGFVPASVSSPSTAEQHSRPTATLVIKAPRPTQAQSDDRAGKRLAEPAVKSEPVHEHTKSRKRTKAAAGMNDSDAEESLSEADPDFMPKSKAKSKAKPKPKQAENPLSQPSPSVMSAPPRAAPSGPPAVPVAPAPDADASAPAIHTPASRPKLLSGAGSAAAPMSSSQSKLCRKALLELRTMNGSIWFLKPVDPVALQIPNYFEIIKHPMDFSTILDNLDSSRYHTADAFVKDVRLVFANAKRFNPPDSQVYRDAESLQAHFEGRWTESILMPAKSVQLAAEPPERMILDDLMIHKDALIFLHPVDPVMYPDYHAKIKRPIDLGTIDARMRRGEYASFEEFDRDIQLLFRNCFTYNSKGTVGYGMGKALESFYQKRFPAPMASVEKRKDALQKGSARNIASLFTTWEIPQFPKSLPAAIARAERRELVRHQLHKLQAKPARGALGSAGSRQKYSRALGQIGYEQLPLLPLRDIPEIEVNTFITDIASRYNQIQDMMQLRGTPRENRELIIKILERFRLITASILEMLRHRKQKMERLGIFEGDTNCGRLRTVFLTELRRRIDTTKLVKHAIIELRGGISTKRAVSAAKTDVALSELQESHIRFEKILAAKQQERELALKAVWQQHKLISEDLISLLRKPRDSDEPDTAVADEGELWEDVDENEYEEQARMELEYNDADIQVMAINATDDPILQAHTEVVRSFNSRVSMRVPKDFISLAAEPTSGAGEFNSEVDNRVLNVLDEKLARYKEVEELYDEIMKTVRGSHMETDEGILIPLTDTYLGVKSVVKPRKKKKWLAKGPTDVGSKSDAESPTGGRRTPTIMLTTRAQRQGAQVHADEFILDRVAAMKKTQSSKYTMRYNFGGYIPTQVAEERRKPREEFGASDYSDYLRGKMCDFLSNMIFQDDDQEDTESESEEIASTLSAEERRKAIEEAERKRKERLERLFDFKKDMWNSEVLDYISEISRAPEPAPAAIRLDVPEAIPEEPDEPTQLAGNHGSESEMTYPNSASQEAPANESAAPAGEHGTQIRQPSNIEVLAAKARKISVEAAHESKKIHDPQAELEALWVVLKMPLDQKLDMAIKYGSHKFTKLSTAIRLWKTASENIMLREKLMSQLEDFEMTASDPAYVARLKEAEKREELMRQLHSLEAKISSIASHIKYELRETVTFDEMAAWSVEETVRYFSSYAAKYDEDLSPETYPAPFVVPAWVLERLLDTPELAQLDKGAGSEPPRPLRVLDLGCGTGQSRACAHLGQPQMLALARKLPFAETHCKDIESELDIGLDFDAVVCIGVMDFCRDPSVFKQLHKMLSPSGCAGITFPDARGDGSLAKFNREQIESLADAHQLSIVRSEQLFGYRDSETGEDTHYIGVVLIRK
nr:hypothetical protein HK105_001554 [Polyrhizophydium stewartii]